MLREEKTNKSDELSHRAFLTGINTVAVKKKKRWRKIRWKNEEQLSEKKNRQHCDLTEREGSVKGWCRAGNYQHTVSDRIQNPHNKGLVNKSNENMRVVRLQMEELRATSRWNKHLKVKTQIAPKYHGNKTRNILLYIILYIFGNFTFLAINYI